MMKGNDGNGQLKVNQTFKSSDSPREELPHNNKSISSLKKKKGLFIWWGEPEPKTKKSYFASKPESEFMAGMRFDSGGKKKKNLRLKSEKPKTDDLVLLADGQHASGFHQWIAQIF